MWKKAWKKAWKKVWKHTTYYLNFYRVHLLSFTLAPLLLAIILYLCNGEFPVPFVDALFVCISAVTGTGLTTVDLSSLTAPQQAIILILGFTGNQAFVAWVIAFVKRRYHRKDFKHVIANDLAVSWKESRSSTINGMMSPGPLSPVPQTPITTEFRDNVLRRRFNFQIPPAAPVVKLKIPQKIDKPALRTDMVRRLEVEPHRINPSGVTSRAILDSPRVQIPTDLSTFISPMSAYPSDGGFSRLGPPPTSINTNAEPKAKKVRIKSPQGLYHRFFPSNLRAKLERTMTMPKTETLIPTTPGAEPVGGRSRRVPYLSFAAIVGRNSTFHGLDEKGIIELAGVEYRALSTLLWVVPLYYLGIVALGIIVITPYMCLPTWSQIFLPPQQHRKIDPVWFSIFQVFGGFSNTGMSLVDQSMVPFRAAYPMIVVLIFVVMSGNSALPIFLRCFIWILSKISRNGSKTKESLVFLLHHPRRCCMSLFPARQTWLLLGMVVLIGAVLAIGTSILNIGNPAFAGIPMGSRVMMALLQAAAVRSAGYVTVSPSAIAPASQIMWLIMMYVAIYPIAMSVQSTNVYEERALGIRESLNIETDSTAGSTSSTSSRVAVWGKYVLRHARRQLAFDMWWLAISLFLLSIVERKALTDTDNATWFNNFALLFEVVSAYGTVGLSLGSPTANYALSGTFHPLSKLIICVVMLRGRHRGLPVALDRAIMLPRELDPESEDLDSVDDEESAYPRFTFPTPIFPPSSFPFTSSFPAPIPEAEDEGSTSTSTTPTSTPSSEKKGMDLEAQ